MNIKITEEEKIEELQRQEDFFLKKYNKSNSDEERDKYIREIDLIKEEIYNLTNKTK